MLRDRAPSDLLATLERAWRSITEHHPDLPPVVIVIGRGSGKRDGGLKYGHFGSPTWFSNEPGSAAMHEVFIGGEGLARGARDTLGTLLHEAAHALAEARGIKDTSRQGRYHNKRFKALGEEVGLVVSYDERLGWSPTTLPPATAELYGPTIAELEQALALRRRADGPRGGTNLIAAACQCPRRIRVAARTLAAGPIVCGICRAPFAPHGHERTSG